MFIHTSDRHLLIDAPSPSPTPFPIVAPAAEHPRRARHFYPGRIAARIFTLIGAAAAVYAAALVGLFFHSGIIAL
ncbi:MAG: hypothetical protein RIB59_16685 [Rhodospirillales bacterium]